MRTLRPSIVRPCALPVLLSIALIAGADATQGQVREAVQEALGVPETGQPRDDETVDPGGPDDAGEEEGLEAPPSVADVVPRTEHLAREAQEARRELRELLEVGAIEERVLELEAERQRLGDRLGEALSQEYVREDRVARVVDEALRLRDRIDQTTGRISERLSSVDALLRSWREREERWRRWRRELQGDPQFDAVYREPLDRGLGTVDSVLNAIDVAVPELVEVQQGLQRVQRANREVLERGQAALRSWRSELLRDNVPPLLTAEHRHRLDADLPRELRAGFRDALGGGVRFRPRDALVGAAQILSALLLGLGIRRLRPKVPGESRWASLLDHPWAIGVLVAVSGSSFLHGPLPPVGRVILGSALAASAAVIASAMFSNPTKRVLAYAISSVFVLFTTLEAVALPVALLRLVLATLALVGAPWLLLLARRSARTGPGEEQRWYLAGLFLGSAALVVVFGAELFGYHFLAQWLAESSVITAFTGFVVTFLLRLGRGALMLAFRSEPARRVELLAQMGTVLADRLLFLLKLVLVGYALLYLASVWELAEGPGQAWNRLVGLGFALGAWELTVGKLLLAAIAVYLALLASWLVRSLLDRTVFERREFERGVRESFFTLLHYTVIVLAVFLALSLLGVDLSTFALVVGALGVGIGFGLQNVVNNFVSGLILLFERPVRVGDIVDVGPERGTIAKIGLRSTVLTTFDGAEQIVPNGDLIAEKVVNWTLSTPRARLRLPVSVAYGNDPARVIEVLVDVARGYELSQAEPAPMAIFTGFGDSSLDFEVRIWLASFDLLLQARSELAARVVGRLAREGIEIPFPQRDLHVRSVRSEAAEGLRRASSPSRAPNTDRPKGEQP